MLIKDYDRTVEQVLSNALFLVASLSAFGYMIYCATTQSFDQWVFAMAVFFATQRITLRLCCLMNKRAKNEFAALSAQRHSRLNEFQNRNY